MVARGLDIRELHLAIVGEGEEEAKEKAFRRHPRFIAEEFIGDGHLITTDRPTDRLDQLSIGLGGLLLSKLRHHQKCSSHQPIS